MAERRQQRPRNNIYTVLAAIALVVMVMSVIFVWMQFMALTGETNPFNVGATSAAAGIDGLRSAVWT
ncbi:MAG: hypothetical protein ACODAQ_05795 [Phycisphaeraceae bacterium]